MSNNQTFANQPADFRSSLSMTPAVDVIEDATGITLYADLPGVPRDKLNLQVEGDTLTIEADLEFNSPDNVQTQHVEVDSPRFRRVFALSKELDAGNVSAELKQGVLKLHIPKTAHAQPRRINVTVN